MFSEIAVASSELVQVQVTQSPAVLASHVVLGIGAGHQETALQLSHPTTAPRGNVVPRYTPGWIHISTVWACQELRGVCIGCQERHIGLTVSDDVAHFKPNDVASFKPNNRLKDT